MVSELSSAIATAKRNCYLCHAHRRFRETEPQRELARTSARNAYELLKIAFEELRAKDAPTKQLDIVREAKALTLEGLDVCKNCDKERPRLKETIIDLK
ncbi:MAG: hypothetical protein GX950_00860 [Candidatus Diapherotrites archaeon]|jgi:hypothetical protein|uniref:HEPN domain-containing protein n=1 Tax=Candidatus Iainarchaeum sp. TaxID=3101447 RepID=A0A7K4BZ43_9ARCH|nr:hypothetical protein [Candidatus Diapherotrites archaeon]